MEERTDASAGDKIMCFYYTEIWVVQQRNSPLVTGQSYLTIGLQLDGETRCGLYLTAEIDKREKMRAKQSNDWDFRVKIVIPWPINGLLHPLNDLNPCETWAPHVWNA